jgi:hypothetical protein
MYLGWGLNASIQAKFKRETGLCTGGFAEISQWRVLEDNPIAALGC